jgi:hypothetical protein
MQAIDCHVNQGAEIEKRKAFVKTSLPVGTYGLLSTPNGLMTFGSQPNTNFGGSFTVITWTTSNAQSSITFVSLPINCFVGQLVSISGTGSQLDGTVQVVNAIFAGSNEITFTTPAFSGHNGIGGTAVFTTDLPNPFIYQQLTDPNIGFNIFNVTEVSNPALNLNIVSWSTSRLHGSVTFASGVNNPGLQLGNQVTFSGTGNTILDGNTFIIEQINTNPLTIYFSTSQTSDVAHNGMGGLMTWYTNNIVTITVASNTLPVSFVAGSTFNLYGLLSTANFLNGAQIVNSITIVGANTLLTIIASFTGTIGNGTTTIGNMSLGTTGGQSMTKVVAACLLNSLPFVVAIFGDGDVGIFYNGFLVNDFFNGAVFSNATSPDNLAVQLANYINATTGYIASVNGATVTCTSINPTDTTKTTPGTDFDVNVTDTTVDGTLTAVKISSAEAVVTGTSATANFTIFAGQTGGSITGIFINATATNISGVVNWNTSIAQTASDVASAINANTATNGGYTAASKSGEVIVTAPIGQAYNDFQLLVTVSQICIDNCYFVYNVGNSGVIFTTSIIPAGGVNILSGTVIQGTGASTDTYLAAVAANIVAHGVYTAVVMPLTDVGNSGFLYISRLSVNSSSSSLTVTTTWSASGNGTIGAALTSAGFLCGLSVASVSSPVSGVGALPTTAVRAKPTGGTAPYKYTWSYYSGSTDIHAVSPNSAATTFVMAAALGNGVTLAQQDGFNTTTIATAKFVCTITDANNFVATSAPVTAACRYALAAPSLGNTQI